MELHALSKALGIVWLGRRMQGCSQDQHCYGSGNVHCSTNGRSFDHGGKNEGRLAPLGSLFRLKVLSSSLWAISAAYDARKLLRENRGSCPLRSLLALTNCWELVSTFLIFINGVSTFFAMTVYCPRQPKLPSFRSTMSPVENN